MYCVLGGDINQNILRFVFWDQITALKSEPTTKSWLYRISSMFISLNLKLKKYFWLYNGNHTFIQTALTTPA